MKIPNVIKLVETEKEELRSCELGRLRSCYLDALALPDLLAPPRLFTLPVGVSLCCAGCEAGVVLGVPSGVWGRGGEQDAEMRGPGWEVGVAVSGECKLYS